MQVDAAASNRPKRRRFRLRGAAKVAVVCAVIGGGGWLAWTLGVSAYLGRIHFTPPVPGSVALIALSQDAGYKAAIIDRVVQLKPDAKNSFEASSSNLGLGGGASNGQKEPNLPISELMGALRGDSGAASRFIMRLNRLEPEQMENERDPEAGWPTVRIYWKAADVQKALNGDAAELKKLTTDLNIGLDGSPLPQLSYRSLENGIIIQIPVSLPVNISGRETEVPATISLPYRPQLMLDIMRKVNESTSNQFSSDPRLALYELMGKEVLDGQRQKEDVRAALQKMTSPSYVKKYMEKAENLINAVTVIVSNDQIKSASQSKEVVNGTTNYDLDLNLTPEGKMRLWKYSHEHHGDQLLLISNGAAIAAPTIESDLMSSQVTIGQMPDEDLVNDAVDSINSRTGGRS